jgi:high affinity Mn2+ porin
MRFAEPMVAPVRKFVVGLLAVALAHVSPEHALATEPASAADQAALPESIAPASPQPAATGDQDLPGRWNVHGQLTFVKQYHPSFTSPYEGPNSLRSARNGEETTDLTLFSGIRLWRGGAFYVNPEVDEGFGLSNTLGTAGFPSGEAYKVGKSKPYFRLQRAFLRQVFDLGGASQTVDSGANEVGGVRSVNNVTLTVGKFSVVDIFDTNSYAHDPRGDFLNWSVIDAAAFDYAADSWGYTVGATLEWTQSWWTLRGGFFDLSNVPNSKTLEPGFREFALIGEIERRYDVGEHPGKLKVLAFVNHARMGRYDDAIRLGQVAGAAPDTALVRRNSSRPGVSINLEQEITNDLGAFARVSFNSGQKEAYDFTDVNRSLSGGFLLKGNQWQRVDDRVGFAVAVNGISDDAHRYFAAGGLGILIGDGQLPHYGSEYILETFYSMHVAEHLTVSADYQHITNPAYNRDRGPVSIFGVRAHAEF